MHGEMLQFWGMPGNEANSFTFTYMYMYMYVFYIRPLCSLHVYVEIKAVFRVHNYMYIGFTG